MLWVRLGGVRRREMGNSRALDNRCGVLNGRECGGQPANAKRKRYQRDDGGEIEEAYASVRGLCRGKRRLR